MYRFSAIFSGLLAFGVASAAIDPQPIPVGGAQLIPTVQIKHSHDDNIFSSELLDDSSTITNISPTIQYLAGTDDQNFFSVTYTGDYARYWQSRDDDYDDHTLELGFGYSGSNFFRFNADASIAKLHDNRGEGASEGIGALTRGSPDEYDNRDAGISFDFGRPNARMGATLSYRILDIEYTNNRAQTAFRDRDDATLEGRIHYNVSDATRLSLGYRDVDIEYDSAPLDSDESTVFVAAEWDITGRTTGNIEIGREDKDFDAGGSEDNTVWSVGISWSPRTYSTFNFTTSQETAETNGTGAAIEQRNYGVSWTHDWSDRLQSNISLSRGDDDYIDDPRTDDRENYSISMNYDFRRWMNLGFGIDWDERDSSVDTSDYDGRVVYITVDLSL